MNDEHRNGPNFKLLPVNIAVLGKFFLIFLHLHYYIGTILATCLHIIAI